MYPVLLKAWHANYRLRVLSELRGDYIHFFPLGHFHCWHTSCTAVANYAISGCNSPAWLLAVQVEAAVQFFFGNFVLQPWLFVFHEVQQCQSRRLRPSHGYWNSSGLSSMHIDVLGSVGYVTKCLPETHLSIHCLCLAHVKSSMFFSS